MSSLTPAFLAFSFLASIASIFLPSSAFPILAATTVLAAGVYNIVLRKKSASDEYDRISGVTLDLEREERAGSKGLTEPVDGFEEERERLREEMRVAVTDQTELRQKLERIQEAVAEIATETENETVSVPNLKADLNAYMMSGSDNMLRLREQIQGLTDIGVTLAGGKKLLPQRATDQSKELGRFISDLEELVDKSNVVGINAAIEAARSGSAGKGFAVIAGEMQSFSTEISELTRGFKSYGEKVILRSTGSRVESENMRERERKINDLGAQIRRAAADVAYLLEPLTDTSALVKIVDGMEGIEAQEKRNSKLRDGLGRIRSLANTEGSVE